MKVLVTTYNAAAKVPVKEEDLLPLLALDHDPDVVSMGFEEIGDWDAWEDEVDRLLEKHGYYRLKLETMWTIQIVVFAKKKHLPYIHYIESCETPTGLKGVCANKGATTVRFRLYGKTVAIVNSHLAAHKEELAARNRDYWTIMREQEFKDSATPNLSDHDFLIWAGDLNYRVDQENAVVRKAVSEGKHLELLQHDQLLREIRQRTAFPGFHEAPITFKPTFKFDPETGFYETRKNRVPSWCDRVLWRTKAEQVEVARLAGWDKRAECSALHRADVDNTEQYEQQLSVIDSAKLEQVVKAHEVKVVFYKSYPEYKLSDHKPVSALLDLDIDTNVKPLVEFTNSQFTDLKRKRLEVQFKVNEGYTASGSDWVALVKPTWTDATKHRITWEWVPSSSRTIKFSESVPSEDHLEVVYVSKALAAPIAIAKIC